MSWEHTDHACKIPTLRSSEEGQADEENSDKPESRHSRVLVWSLFSENRSTARRISVGVLVYPFALVNELLMIHYFL